MTYYLLNKNFEVLASTADYANAIEMADVLDGDIYLVSTLTPAGLQNEIEELKAKAGI